MIKTAGIAFADAKAGDRIHFTIRDTGFGGGGLIYQVGTVTKTTEKTVTLEYEGIGTRTARIRRTDWHERCLGLVIEEN